MAKTYYKYKERGGIVDYAAISKDFSTGISGIIGDIEQGADELTEDILKAQEGVKADVEKEIRAKEAEAAEKARARAEAAKKSEIKVGEYDLPLGIERDANSVFVDLSTQAADRGLEFKRQLDSQEISEADWKQKNNALKRTFSVLKESAVAMNLLAEETAAGIKNGTTDPTQQLAYQELMSYNFTDPRVKIEIGGDGVGFVYRVDDEGKELPRSRKTIYEYRNMAIQRYDSYDFDGNATGIVTDLGETLETLGRRGMTTEELLKREPIMNSVNGGEITPMTIIDNYANGLDDDKLASILMGQLGSKYSPTFNPEESVTEDASGNFTDDQSKILFVKRDLASGVNKKTAQLTDEQRERAREFVKTNILSQFNVKPAATTGTSATERKAAKERDKNIEAAKLDVATLRKIFEAKTSADVNKGLARYSNQLMDLIPEQDKKNSEFIRVELVGTDDNRAINVIYRDQYGKKKSRDTGVEIPDNFQDFVASGGVLITGNDNLRTLRKEAMSEIDDPSALIRGDFGGEYAIEVLEEALPAVDSDVSLSEAVDTVVSELDAWSYANMGTAYSDMSTAAVDMFKKMGFKDYSISQDGDNILISVEGYDIPSFNMSKDDTFDGNKHDKRRGDFKRHMSSIYTALTTGKKFGGSGVKKTLVQLKAENPNMTMEELNKLLNNQ